jgi:hypothetical protein
MGWLTATPSALQHMEVDKEIVLASVIYGYSRQSHRHVVKRKLHMGDF